MGSSGWVSSAPDHAPHGPPHDPDGLPDRVEKNPPIHVTPCTCLAVS